MNNIAALAYQDGQQYRKDHSMPIADVALENQAMQGFTQAGTDFQHWQLYHENWLSGYQSMKGEQKVEEATTMIDDNTYTLVPSRNSGCYTLNDPEDGRDIASGDALAILLNGHWIQGSIAHDAYRYAIEAAPRRVYSGYFFLDSGGNICGLCAGMKVRLG
jgi:hypothetical protein